MAIPTPTTIFNWYKRYKVLAQDMTDLQNYLLTNANAQIQGLFSSAIVDGFQPGSSASMTISIQPGTAFGPSGYLYAASAVTNVLTVAPTGSTPTRSLIVARPNLSNISSMINPSDPFSTVFLKTIMGTQVILLQGTAASSPSYPATEVNDTIICGIRNYPGQTTIRMEDIDLDIRDAVGRNATLVQNLNSFDDRLRPYRSTNQIIGIRPSQYVNGQKKQFKASASNRGSIFPKNPAGSFNANDTFVNFQTGVINGGDGSSSAFTPSFPTSGNAINATVVLGTNNTLSVFYGTTGTRQQCYSGIENQTATGAGSVSIPTTGQPIAFVLLSSSNGTTITELDIFDARGILQGGGGGSVSGKGIKNYIKAPDDANALYWFSSNGSLLSVTTETTTTLFPNDQTKTTAIKILGLSGSGAYAYTRWTMDASDYSWLCGILADFKYSGTAGDFQFQLYTNTASDYSGTSTQITLPVSNIPTSGSGSNQFQTSGLSGGSTAPYMELRIVRTGSSTTPLYMNAVTFTPNPPSQGAGIGEWTQFTPTFAGFGTATSISFWYRLNGSAIEVHGLFTTGTVAAATASIGMPSGYTINSTATPTTANVGNYTRGASVSSKAGAILCIPGVTITDVYFGGLFGATDAGLTRQNGNVVSGNTETISVFFTVPINQASAVLNLGQGAQVEYAYNSSVTTASDTTSFATGPVGALIQNFAPAGTGNVIKRVQFQYPIQNGDIVSMEVQDPTSGVWLEVTARFGGFSTNDANSVYQGQTLAQVSSTQVNVAFYSTTVGGGTWASINTWRWRVKKATPSAPVGFGKASVALGFGLVAPLTGQTALTVTSSAAGWSTIRAQGIYYQDQDGNHRLRFNLIGSITSKTYTTDTVTISGVTFKNVANFFQPCAGGTHGTTPGAIVQCYTNPNASTITLVTLSGTGITGVAVSGDVELESKPSWA